MRADKGDQEQIWDLTKAAIFQGGGDFKLLFEQYNRLKQQLQVGRTPRAHSA